MIGNKKTAVMYGAGNIGRGFIGQIFHDSGFEVVFIDINPVIVDALNDKRSYTQEIIEDDATSSREIIPVRAVDGYDHEAVAKDIANCDIMAVSVGAAALSYIAPVIAAGLVLRERSLNILVCENLAHAPDILKKHVAGHLSDLSLFNKVGFVGTTIGRMVPFVPQQQKEADPLKIVVEKFCILPIDGDAIVSPMPELQHTVHCRPFALEEEKKLFIHNMGHALAAYFGALKSYTYIWQAIEDNEINGYVRTAMTATAKALSIKYNKNIKEVTGYMDDLLQRFGNKGLGDTITRVGGDPMRKLAPGDRLIGAVDLCKEQGIDYESILTGIAAALRYSAPDDPSANQLQNRLTGSGVRTFLTTYCGLSISDITKVRQSLGAVIY